MLTGRSPSDAVRCTPGAADDSGVVDANVSEGRTDVDGDGGAAVGAVGDDGDALVESFVGIGVGADTAAGVIGAAAGERCTDGVVVVGALMEDGAVGSLVVGCVLNAEGVLASLVTVVAPVVLNGAGAAFGAILGVGVLVEDVEGCAERCTPGAVVLFIFTDDVDDAGV